MIELGFLQCRVNYEKPLNNRLPAKYLFSWTPQKGINTWKQHYHSLWENASCRASGNTDPCPAMSKRCCCLVCVLICTKCFLCLFPKGWNCKTTGTFRAESWEIPVAPTSCHENWWYLATCQSLIPSSESCTGKGASGSQVGSVWAPANITSPQQWETWTLATGLFPATDTAAYHAWKTEQTALHFGPHC